MIICLSYSSVSVLLELTCCTGIIDYFQFSLLKFHSNCFLISPSFLLNSILHCDFYVRISFLPCLSASVIVPSSLGSANLALFFYHLGFQYLFICLYSGYFLYLCCYCYNSLQATSGVYRSGKPQGNLNWIFHLIYGECSGPTHHVLGYRRVFVFFFFSTGHFPAQGFNSQLLRQQNDKQCYNALGYCIVQFSLVYLKP